MCVTALFFILIFNFTNRGKNREKCRNKWFEGGSPQTKTEEKKKKDQAGKQATEFFLVSSGGLAFV